MATSTELGWYGKLPAAGDFVHRRMPESQLAQWSNWFKSGVVQWQQLHNNCTEAFARAPIWNFALPATLGVQQVQIGCLMPSRDRVGRVWALMAAQKIAVSQWHPVQLAMAGEWFNALGTALQQAVHQQKSVDETELAITNLDPLPETVKLDASTIIGYRDSPTLAWPEVSRRFDPLQYTSYWWTNQYDGCPLVTHKHSGNLTAQLFTQLFHPTLAENPGRHGLYPPMFDQAD
ncbi:type VI secretion system-associated protein TagF [Erwinia sp. S43]|uniref:type VI secretion system-associated protein TagF n=1 Tax=Erwinia sp. S43 TaxID=2769339 RepID=UPI00190B5BD8|nr:type VI secretion system-associated protein TagF [Erwinia sp. S43]MBK0030658.1 type VI secretion system-associated protein TagF [Erwinia sp. S43]